jgi:DNA-binding MarR family transcriptional regulator
MAQKPRASSAEESYHRLEQSLLASDLEFLTARARAIGTKNANKRLEPFGIKVRDFAVLSLVCTDERPSQRELAEFLRLDASQVVILVDSLEKLGLVERQTDARDRRSNILVPTEAGMALFAEAQIAVDEAREESLEGLSDTERDELQRLLTRIAFNR